MLRDVFGVVVFLAIGFVGVVIWSIIIRGVIGWLNSFNKGKKG